MEVTNTFSLITSSDKDNVDKKFDKFDRKCFEESKHIFNKLGPGSQYKYSHQTNIYLKRVEEVKGIRKFFKKNKNKYNYGKEFGNLSAVFYTQENNFNVSVFTPYLEPVVMHHYELNKKEGIKTLSDFNWKCFCFGAIYNEDQIFFFKGISDTHRLKGDFDKLINLVNNNIDNYGIAFQRVSTFHEDLIDLGAKESDIYFL